MKRTIPFLLLAGALVGTLGLAPTDQTPLFTGLTSASDSRKLGFDIRGVVAKVEVKKNQKVAAGQLLISLDDREERARLEYYKKRADTSLSVAEAEETYKVKKIDYERKLEMFKQGSVATDFEVKTAEAEMNISKIKIEQAKHDSDVATAEMASQQMRVDRMSVMSPIDGEVADVIVKAGEQVDESKPVLQIVDLDPLYVDVTLVDTAVVQKLKIGQTLRVRYGKESQWVAATIDAIDTEADKRSGTHPFRLSMPNPEMRPGGQKVEVEIPASFVADAKQ
jgi:RND family efflux transporter MFP subunit